MPEGVRFEHAASLVFNRPLMLHRPMLESVVGVMLRRGAGERLAEAQIDAIVAEGAREREARREAYTRDGRESRPVLGGESEVVDGVCVVPVQGVIEKRGAAVQRTSCGDFCGCQGVRSEIEAALDDPGVHTILLDIDSPGGSTDGPFELADFIRTAAADKRVEAFANGLCASAAYAIGCAAGALHTTRSAIVGSIGVYTAFMDWTAYLKGEGITPHFIQAGAHKAVGNPIRENTDEDIASVQAVVDKLYDEFVGTVAACRGLDPERVRATEARVFVGDQALAQGLCDSVTTFEELLDALAEAGGATGEASARASAGDTDMGIIRRTTKQRGAAGADLKLGPRGQGDGDDDEEEEATGAGAETDEDEEGAETDEDDPEAEGDDEDEGAQTDEDEEKPAKKAKAGAVGAVAAERARAGKILAFAAKVGAPTEAAMALVNDGASVEAAYEALADAAARTRGAQEGDAPKGAQRRRAALQSLAAQTPALLGQPTGGTVSAALGGDGSGLAASHRDFDGLVDDVQAQSAARGRSIDRAKAARIAAEQNIGLYRKQCAAQRVDLKRLKVAAAREN